jgi:hypothetical protein
MRPIVVAEMVKNVRGNPADLSAGYLLHECDLGEERIKMYWVQARILAISEMSARFSICISIRQQICG